MGIAKPLASLSSGLLARKGQARPAMRPQGFASLTSLAQAGDQLGWNDMGDAPEASAPALPPELPPVLVERETLVDHFVPSPTPSPASVEGKARAAAGAAGKAAFTLRLDADRHLRLRLASATQGRSSQQLVTAALDQFLANLPEVDTLARQLGRAKR